MTDTVKLIIEIPKEAKQAFDNAYSNDLRGGYYDCGGVIGKAIQNGTPLDDVKAEMQKVRRFHVGNFEDDNPIDYGIVEGFDKAIAILDNIGKAESEDK